MSLQSVVGVVYNDVVMCVVVEIDVGTELLVVAMDVAMDTLVVAMDTLVAAMDTLVVVGELGDVSEVVIVDVVGVV